MVFKSFSKLESHLDVSDHITEKTKDAKKCRREKAFKFQSADVRTDDTTSTTAPCPKPWREAEQTEKIICDLGMGWALHKPRVGTVRFGSNVVKNYLTKRFNIGERTGIKSDPVHVAADMRTAKTADGSRLFSRSEWLTKSQVQGFSLSTSLY